MTHLFAIDQDAESLDEGGTWLLDLVSAVDHLRRGYRPGFTVWDALAEAIGCSAAAIASDGSLRARMERDIARAPPIGRKGPPTLVTPERGRPP